MDHKTSLPTGLTAGDRVEVHRDGKVAVGTVTLVLVREGVRGGVVEVARDGSFTGLEAGDTIALHPADCSHCDS